ncbi:uncharacterized protein DNG_03626 [Cephalotrichum gorgonifer]|uniref:Fibroin-3 related protein n=1 Tax=Cephalotrichum gorgonifer TaxID=2041049 RepID=A0AAE8MX57_9PEZI|nr:uncharacterized protein DNG_03626 [Cephalotrichum gorgonifer]
MPTIDVAMARSLRGGVWGSIAEGLQSSIAPRDVVGDIKNKASDAKLAFSSWDNCMQATYCKWPVIAIIVVGSLILFSICLKCCGNCCGCCDPPKGARHKYLDNETAPPNFGYKPEPPMHAPDFGPSRTTAPSYDAPQYASFDMPKRGGEDALPTMPTWETSAAKKVATEEEEVEMNQLNKPAHTGQSVASASAAAAASAAAVAAAAGGQGGHGMSPGGYRQPSPVGARGYAGQDPYATSAQGYGAQGYDGYNNGGYRQPASPYGSDQFGAVAAMSAAPRRGPTPHQDYGNGYDQQQGYNAGHMDHGYTQAPQPTDPYAVDPRRPSPGPGAYNGSQMRHSPVPRMGHSPAPQAAYGYPQQQPQQQYGSDAGYRQPQFTSELPDTSVNNTAVNNTGGFDFTSGYSRPPAHQQYSYDRQPSPAPPQQAPSPGPARNGGFSAYTPQAS